MSAKSSPDQSAAPGDLPPAGDRRRLRENLDLVTFSQAGLFVLAAIGALYFVRPILLPLVIALLITLLLKPIQRRLELLLRMPGPLAAAAVMAVVLAAIVMGLVYLATPAAQYASQLREEIVQNRLRTAFQPITTIHEEITEVAGKVEDLTAPQVSPEATRGATPGDTPDVAPAKDEAAEGLRVETPGPNLPSNAQEEAVPKPKSPPPVKVEIREDRVGSFYGFAQALGLQAFITSALVFFFLAFGDNLIRRLGEVDLAAELIDDITRDVSHYLLTITTINVILGAVTAVAMGLLGMPNPVLWGVMAAFLNFIPYLGAITGTAIVCLVAAISFAHPGEILPVPMVYYALTAIEGYFVTPTIIGRRFTVNPIIVFVWVLCWGALWGIAGMLIALPFLMVFRIICAKLPSLSRLERVLSA